MNDVYLSIGTNIGNREQNLKHALNLLNDKTGLSIIKISSIYETAPVGFLNQPSFLNIAVYLQTQFSAQEMLILCQSVENELGRVRKERWGPRIIDLDILLFNNDNIEVENLTIPHPRMFERAFVLVPLMEIAQVPLTNQLQEAQKNFEMLDLQQEGIIKWKSTNNVQEFLQFEAQ
nr:2-amino-4-hydroxy-6-hydroxymethyldihydropteridine diphosphokinase [Lysinibacillus timonensis]